MAAADKVKQKDSTLVTFRFSRHYNANARVIWRNHKPLICVSQFCEGMAKNLNWAAKNFDVADKLKRAVAAAIVKLCRKERIKGDQRAQAKHLMFYSPELISRGLHEVMHLIHAENIPTMKEMAIWLCSEELHSQLQEAAAFTSAIVVADIKLKHRTPNPGDWGYSKGSSFKIPPKIAPWDIDTTARFRAANARTTSNKEGAGATV